MTSEKLPPLTSLGLVSLVPLDFEAPIIYLMSVWGFRPRDSVTLTFLFLLRLRGCKTTGVSGQVD